MDNLESQIMEKPNVYVQPTPNPNALKFILDRPVKTEGNSTYRSPIECDDNNLAKMLFTIRGVDQLHFFDNTITITKFSYEDWDAIEPTIIETLEKEVPAHDPNYHDPDPEADRRKELSPELLAIEEVLDKTIRPGLQADGGDIQALSFEDHILLIKYMGACGTCPSSTTGTLEAIKGILREQYDPEIDVYIAPDY
jgi:NFU1 iron-sulfur cluster scaffold homolog, mitochondrial